jgi:putative ABC transport system permease protein
VVKVKKIFLLAFANIRKSKGHTVSLFIMFLISALLLNAGLLVLLNFGGFFEKITKELNTSDVYYIVPNHLYNSEIDEYLENNDNIKELQKEESLWTMAKWRYKDETVEKTFLFNDAEKERSLTKWKFIGEHLEPEDMSAYIPYYYYLSDGYRLNDQFELLIKDTKLTFTIKGFIEDTYFSSSETGVMGFYLPHATYEKVADLLDSETQATLIFANLYKNNKEVDAGIKKLLKSDTSATNTVTDYTSTMFNLDKALVSMSRTLMANMVSVMFVAFAAIIVAVCLIVVRYRIGNSIEDDMTKIGSLKAGGYTSRQIILSIVVQFTVIAFAGSAVGISLSYLTTPVLSDILAQQSALKWVQGFDGSISSISLGTILLFVTFIAYVAARRINRLNPIIALRGGIITHNFRKNHMPLNKSKGSLSIVLAIKSLLQNKKQSIMITIILIAVSFAGAFAVIMFYNTTIDIKAFKETPGVELSNAVAVLNPDMDNTELIENIKNMEGVRKVQFIDQVKLMVDGNEVYSYVMKDYATKETDTVYEGRYPIHNNEIVIAGYLADILDKKVGDSVTLSAGDKSTKLLITGLSNGAYMGGMNASIRFDSMEELDPGFRQINLQIYLKKGVNAEEFIIELKAQYGTSLASTLNMDKEMEIGTSVYTSIISKVGIVMLTITIIVVILVLYFVINSSVTRRKRELGIQKAIGFTTLQLMNQLSLSFLPPVIVGVVIGSIIGATQGNAIMSIAQRSMGIMKANYIVTPVWIALFGAAIVLVSYVTSMLITSRIRKISAYSLVSE